MSYCLVKSTCKVIREKNYGFKVIYYIKETDLSHGDTVLVSNKHNNGWELNKIIQGFERPDVTIKSFSINREFRSSVKTHSVNEISVTSQAEKLNN